MLVLFVILKLSEPVLLVEPDSLFSGNGVTAEVLPLVEVEPLVLIDSDGLSGCGFTADVLPDVELLRLALTEVLKLSLALTGPLSIK